MENELGAVGFQLERLPDGAWHFVCWLPRPAPSPPERLEARGTTEAEAVRLGLDRAGQWRRERP